MLEFRDLRRDFGDVRAVDGVSLSIPQGAFVGIIGSSGAGKSTLLRLTNRLVAPTSGDVVWQGQSVLSLKGRRLRGWRRRCAMIFQQFNLVPRLDAITNVLVGSLADRPVWAAMIKQFPAEVRAQAVLELDRLGLAQVALKRAELLSGGQQQRVAIARAMLQQPDILLADEPIASLDPINAEAVMGALARINKEQGLTVIVNLHALDVARRYCGRIVGMAAGKVVFDGPPSALTADAVAQIYGGEPAPLEARAVEPAA